MANTKEYNVYYKYTNTDAEYTKSSINLAAVGERNEILIGIAEDDGSVAAIRLNEQEQNDLIAGILERRGIKLVKMEISEEWVEIPIAPISATDSEQSSIHPAE